MNKEKRIKLRKSKNSLSFQMMVIRQYEVERAKQLYTQIQLNKVIDSRAFILFSVTQCSRIRIQR